MAISAILFSFLLFQTIVSSTVGKPKFSLFNVVAFPNDECKSSSDDGLTGLCYSAEDCGERGGTEDGSCASGFGVCCIFRVSDCSSTINQNVTYIQNENFPTGFTTASKTCSYTISGADDICALRFDFETTTDLAQPSNVGACSDGFEVDGGSNYDLAKLCGTLTGTHMYVETGRQTTAGKVTISTGTGTDSRKWNIKVSKIECFSPTRPPNDCVQYYKGLSGRMKSFNFGNGLMTDLKYDMCIRQETGYCTFVLSQSQASPDGFALGPSTSEAEQGADCTKAFIQLGTTGLTDKYCGAELNQVDANTTPGQVIGTTLPFRVRVATTGDQLDASGFDLTYQQRPC